MIKINLSERLSNRLSRCHAKRWTGFSWWAKMWEIYGGAFAVSKGLWRNLEADRIMDVPPPAIRIYRSRNRSSTCRDVADVEVMELSISVFCDGSIFKMRRHFPAHCSADSSKVPVVIPMGCGIGGKLAAQGIPISWSLLCQCTGLIVLSAGTHQVMRVGCWFPRWRSWSGKSFFVIYFMLNSGEGNPSRFRSGWKLQKKPKVPFAEGKKDISLITYGSGGLQMLEACRSPWRWRNRLPR